MAFDNKSALNHAIRYLTQVAERRAAGGWLPPKERERQQRDAMRQEQQQVRQVEKQQQAQQKQFIADEKERQNNFENWFGYSHLVDEKGKPMVLYHGTDADFSKFDATKSGSTDHGWYGIGHYLTSNPELGSAYSSYKNTKAIFGEEIHPGQNVMPVHARLENPYFWPENRPAATSREDAEKITHELKMLGHDGVIAPNKYVDGHEGKFWEVVVFHPHQIKSATGNQGTFDPSNPDITKSEGGSIGWSKNRTDREIRTSHYNDGRSKNYVGYINPMDYLHATTPDDEWLKKIIDEAGDFKPEKIKAETHTPELIIENGKIDGHEGRHRMAGLAQAGHTLVPVAIVHRGSGQHRQPIDSATFGPQFDGRKPVTVSNLIPLHRDYADQINEMMAQHEDHFASGGLILSKQYPTQYMPNVGRQVMADGGMPENGDHPHWIPTRLPKIEKNRAPNQIVDYETARNAPGGYFAKNMAHIRDYVNIPKNIAQNATDDELAEHFINHIKDNLLDLHDSIPPEIRERSKKWYDGARAITDRWSKQYNLPDYSVAGVLAALSPQMDWFKNVSLANRVLDIMSNHHDKPFDDQMLSKFGELTELAKKPEYTALAQMLHGKSLTDIDNLGLPEKERVAAKALWLRTHDETYGDRRHQIVAPEGDLGDYVTSASGAPKGTGWGSFNEIGKAIKAIELKDDPDGISPLMGMKHKVRNFYNNILAPNSTKGDVTIDTHAVAAGLYRPLSGNSLEVAHNLGTSPPAGMKGAADSATVGLSGTYPIFAEAYRRAAAERNILPRQMQSITWEAIRSLYPDTFKRGKKIQDIDDIWTQHKNGLIDQSQAREMAREIALGKGNSIPPPSWFGGGILGGASGSNAPVENTGEQGILSGLGVSGQQAGEVDARGRDGFAAGVPQEGQVKFARGGQTRSRHPALSIAGTHIREEEHGEPMFTGRL